MADAAIWIEAAAPALGWKTNEFLNIYSANRSAANQETLDDSPVGKVLLELLEAYPDGWSGTADRLRVALRDRLNSDSEKLPDGWPRHGRGMSAALRRIRPNLRKIGVIITFADEAPGARKDRKGSRVLSIKKTILEKLPDEVAVESSETSDRQKSAENIIKSSSFASDGRSDGLSSSLQSSDQSSDVLTDQFEQFRLEPVEVQIKWLNELPDERANAWMRMLTERPLSAIERLGVRMRREKRRAAWERLVKDPARQPDPDWWDHPERFTCTMWEMEEIWAQEDRLTN
jgi:hypothetical protein